MMWVWVQWIGGWTLALVLVLVLTLTLLHPLFGQMMLQMMGVTTVTTTTMTACVSRQILHTPSGVNGSGREEERVSL